MKYNIIAFTGLMESGKTTAAEHLVSQGKVLAKFSFASEIKRIAVDDFDWDGVKDEKGRRLLQIIGTECGRAYKDTIWIEKLWHNIFTFALNTMTPGELTGRTWKVAIDDVRYDNEAKWIKENNGVIIRLVKNGQVNNNDHISEKGVSDHLIDYHIEAGDVDDLYKKLDKLMEVL